MPEEISKAQDELRDPLKGSPEVRGKVTKGSLTSDRSTPSDQKSNNKNKIIAFVLSSLAISGALGRELITKFISDLLIPKIINVADEEKNALKELEKDSNLPKPNEDDVTVKNKIRKIGSIIENTLSINEWGWIY